MQNVFKSTFVLLCSIEMFVHVQSFKTCLHVCLCARHNLLWWIWNCFVIIPIFLGHKTRGTSHQNALKTQTSDHGLFLHRSRPQAFFFSERSRFLEKSNCEASRRSKSACLRSSHSRVFAETFMRLSFSRRLCQEEVHWFNSRRTHRDAQFQSCCKTQLRFKNTGCDLKHMLITSLYLGALTWACLQPSSSS